MFCIYLTILLLDHTSTYINLVRQSLCTVCHINFVGYDLDQYRDSVFVGQYKSRETVSLLASINLVRQSLCWPA